LAAVLSCGWAGSCQYVIGLESRYVHVLFEQAKAVGVDGARERAAQLVKRPSVKFFFDPERDAIL
jgi:hypothetical protein